MDSRLEIIKQRMIDAGIATDEVDNLVKPLASELERRVCGLVWKHEGATTKLVEDMEDKLPVLTPVKDKNIVQDEKGINHVLIEGENLLTLMAMQYTHIDENRKGLINVCYIDPPYNTELTNMAYADKFEKSEWLSMMNIRLKLTHNILSDDGILLISINDKYQAELKCLCDDIFGYKNHITNLIWQTKNEAKGIPPKNMCVVNHEYILAYSKSESFKFVGVLRNIEDGFSNPDNDSRGPWKRQYLQRFGQGFKERTIINPANGMSFTFETPYTENKMNDWIKEGRIIFPDKPSAYPARKEFFYEYGNPYKPITSNLGLFSTKVNSEYLKSLFNGEKVFDYPKPLDLIKTILRYSYSNNAIVLDYFGGSGTTAQAVMELNNEDNGTRQCIICTNNELGKEAIKKAKLNGVTPNTPEYEEYGVCHAVTYPRLKTVITGDRMDGTKYSDGIAGNNLYYYQVSGSITESPIPKITKDALSKQAVSYIALKENIFNVDEHEDYHILHNTNTEIIVVIDLDRDYRDVQDNIASQVFSKANRKVYCSLKRRTVVNGVEYIPYPEEVLDVLKSVKKRVRRESQR